MELLKSFDGSAIDLGTLQEAYDTLNLETESTGKYIVDVELVPGTENCQSTAHSGILRLTASDGNTTEVFLKKVTASASQKREWNDRRRYLVYARTEARFYEEFSHILKHRNVPIPTLATSKKNLDSVLGDSELSGPVNEEPEAKILQHAGCFLFLSCAGRKLIQESPLSEKMAEIALNTVARLHAAAWEDKELLEKAASRLQRFGGSFALSMRNPKEIQKIPGNWKRFSDVFSPLNPDLFERKGIDQLGTRLVAIAPWVAKQLSVLPDQRHATLIHGDFKAMNVFLPAEHSNERDGLLIDFASTGVGYGMSDVAMHLSHSVSPEVLANGGEERLIASYINALKKVYAERGAGMAMCEYPPSVASLHYKLGVVDYARFVLGRFWGNASPEVFLSKADKPNVTLVNRNAKAALAFVEKTHRCLLELEQLSQIDERVVKD
uniref:Uncharacterized protein n=1 Tax=Aplanochytrium stocchinoi TaxID=215587 RepID=A0A6S8A469_9STRA